ncbi:alpha-2-macroglobulin family protein [Acidithiobacillus caldus ATCC 51756]|uniref:Alpha-2-macroglobulin n=3 Tax=Acidithiobacillus caldus TaxID=33059 RepID=A0A1E7YQ26_9PROT|nr:alpha-2-macroglobulin family protein [Acidithiobacillus caldus]MBU2734536.1 alpha-2-macroglobulin family protein [Acidithiobacillus caldus ATCC 51756]MBU2781153.1 alpha-2-macroglobulin family protein [Acidithiobacillus caldus]MBU2782897.1 alpha-2-macroglobulin family protein [Acidithiobacillus caldus]OFC38186.1 alpha-2-macroglobulin [Acidithiobacillus caldus]
MDEQQKRSPDSVTPEGPRSAGVGRILRRFWNGLKSLWIMLFGQIHWIGPRWLQKLWQGLCRRPFTVAVVALLLLAMGFGAERGYRWYSHRPQVKGVTVQIQAPEVTNYGKTPVEVHPLILRFSESAAPLAQVDKVAGPGLELQPRIAGQWRWEGDDRLSFTPQADWPVGQKFRLRIDAEKALRRGALLNKTRYEFRTEPFGYRIEKEEFYQDSENPLNKSALFTLKFNYPVAPESLAKAVHLQQQVPSARWKYLFRPGAKVPAVITYDARGLQAFVRSERLQTPVDSQKLRLTVDKGVRSQRGGPATTEPQEGEVTIPGLYSLSLSEVKLTLVDDEQGIPHQTLLVESSSPVLGKDLQKQTRVWLLPATDADGREHRYWSASEVSTEVLQRSTSLNLDLQPTERDADTLQAFRLQAPPRRSLFVEIHSGLVAAGGYQLGRSVTRTVSVPDYPKLLKFMGSGALLTLGGDRKVTVVARNLPGAQMRIGRLQPEQLQHLVALNRGDFQNPRLEIGSKHLVARFHEEVALPSDDPGQLHYHGFDLGPYLARNGREHGVFLLELASWNPQQPRVWPGDSDAFEGSAYHSERSDGDSRLIVITDLGLLAKRNADGSWEVFVQSLAKGQPVAGVMVQVLALNGEVLRRATTGADGHVHFPELSGFYDEQRAVAFTAMTGDGSDFSFLPMDRSDRELDYSRFDVGGAPNARDGGELSAFLFSDRGLYRPGERMHLGIILRTADWHGDMSGMPLEIRLSDARGRTVARQKLRADADGFLEWDYRTVDSAPTGTWTAELYLTKEDTEQRLGSTTVQVKEFEPDRTRTRLAFVPAQAKGWVKPGGLKAELQADTLYGTPADHRRVSASLQLRPAVPAFASWADYRFSDPRKAKEGYSESLADMQTDDSGRVIFPVDLSGFAPATYTLDLYTQVFEPGSGRSVAARATTLVSSADYLVGIKTTDSLDFIARGATRKVGIVAVNPQLEAIAVEGLRAKIVEARYVSVLTKQDSGVYKYESRLKETELSSTPLKLPKGPLAFPLPTDKPGTFALILEDRDGRRLNRVDYMVAGNADLSRSLERNAELELRLDRKDYAPGDQIAVSIRAPYAGNGLITIERDKVYAWTWFHAGASASVQHITVPEGLEGNAYVNVQFVRDPSSAEIFTSPLSYGVEPFSVDRSARTQPLQIQAAQQIKPGQTLDLTVKTAGKAQVAVFAVDAGILQVAHYRLENPLDYFLRKRMLDVQSAQILDLILPSFRQFTAASHVGGDEDASRGQLLNPFKGKHEVPVAWWSGIVTVDGSRRFQYTVPDSFNGELKLMAVAVTPERIGIAENHTTVRGDFILSPNVPPALAPGDRFDASVQVVNNLPAGTPGGNDLRVELQVGPGLALDGAKIQQLRLAPGQSSLVHFPVQALQRLGPSELLYRVWTGERATLRKVAISVRPAAARLTELRSGRLKPGQTEIVSPLEEFFPERSARLAAMSFSPMVLARGLTSYLDTYSHYCTEQLISAATPALIAAQHPEFALDAAAASQAPQRIARMLETLGNRQNGEGGFGVWTATPVADPFVSTYAVDFLLQARQSGLSVPADMLDRGLAYLRHMAADDGLGSLPELRARAYAIYVLTASGQVTSNLIAGVQQRLQSAYPAVWKQDLAAAYLAASYQMLKQQETADDLIRGPWQAFLKNAEVGNDWGYAYYDDPLIRRAQTLAIVERYFPKLAAGLSVERLDGMLKLVDDNRYNSLSSALTLLALTNLPAGAVPPKGLAMAQSAEAGKDGPFSAFGEIQGVLLRGSLSPRSRALRLSYAKGEGDKHPAWFSLSQSGYPRATPTKPLREGMEILREYRDAQGRPVQSLELGQEVTVRIRLRSLKDSVDNVAIVDILPGGFEVVSGPAKPTVASAVRSDAHEADDGDSGDEAETQDTPESEGDGLAQPGTTLTPEYVDIREDRVLLYARAEPKAKEYIYRIRPTSVGRFATAPIYAESLYNRRQRAYAPAGAVLQVKAVSVGAKPKAPAPAKP